MNIGFWVFILLEIISLMYVANKHGQPKGNYNFWSGLLSTLIVITLVLWVAGWNVL